VPGKTSYNSTIPNKIYNLQITKENFFIKKFSKVNKIYKLQKKIFFKKNFLKNFFLKKFSKVNKIYNLPNEGKKI